MVGGHQRRGRLRGQRGGALLAEFAPPPAAPSIAVVGVRHAAHDDQRMDAFAARIERGVGRAGLVEGVGGEAPALDLVTALRCASGRDAPPRR